MEQTQEEFYFALPYAQMDLCLYGLEHDIPAADVAPPPASLSSRSTSSGRDIEAKRRATRYLHEPPLLVTDEIDEVAEPGALSA